MKEKSEKVANVMINTVILQNSVLSSIFAINGRQKSKNNMTYKVK